MVLLSILVNNLYKIHLIIIIMVIKQRLISLTARTIIWIQFYNFAQFFKFLNEYLSDFSKINFTICIMVHIIVFKTFSNNINTFNGII
jgi:hypothetical protein